MDANASPREAHGGRPHARSGARPARALLAIAAATLLALNSACAFEGNKMPATPASPAEQSADQLIVKYRGDAPSAASLARARAAGQPFGVQLSPLRRMGNGAQIYKLDRALPVSTLQRIAQALRDGDAEVEYAEPDVMLQLQRAPGGPM